VIVVLTANAQSTSKTGLRLIALNETHTEWMTPEQVFELAISQVHFMDITDFQNLPHKKPKVFQIPERPAFEAVVNPLLQEIDIEKLLGSLVQLSSFPTRYYTTDTGVQAAIFIENEYKSRSAGRNDITVTRFQHNFPQNSVIARIEGSGPNADELVIIGGHIDSVSNSGNAPGADDDGTGSCTVLEIFRVLAESGFKPKRTIEFHGYAAEEVGLYGSQAVATAYANAGADVFGMLQLDMTGWFSPGTTETIFLVTDFVSPQLNNFLRQLVDTYTELPWGNMVCGYACSDHASWNRSGYTASFIHEYCCTGNPYVHSSRDTIEHLNTRHMMAFAQLGLSYAVEMSLAE